MLLVNSEWCTSNTACGVYLVLCCVCCSEGSLPAPVQLPRFGCSGPAVGRCSPAGTVLKLSWSPLRRLYREESCQIKPSQRVWQKLIKLRLSLCLHTVNACILLMCITSVDVLHDCCRLPPLGHPGLGSPCWTASQRQTKKTCDWLLALNDSNIRRLRLTSVLRPMKGMLVSHIATRWANSLLKAHISPDLLGFFGSGSPWSPDIYRTSATETNPRILI